MQIQKLHTKMKFAILYIFVFSSMQLQKFRTKINRSAYGKWTCLIIKSAHQTNHLPCLTLSKKKKKKRQAITLQILQILENFKRDLNLSITL